MFCIKLSVVLFMSLTITEAVPPLLEPLIIFGRRARIEDYPFFAGTENCGASILSERWLLTAAHCVHSYDVMGNRAVFVGGERMDNSIILRYDHVIIHPQYRRLTRTTPPTYDIALLRLQTPLMFSSKVKPVKLPTPGMIRSPRLRFVGRGNDETGRLSVSMMQMDVVELSRQECVRGTGQSSYHDLFMTDTLICGRKIDGAPGLCFGDSGSPLLQGDTIVGLASFLMGTDCKRVNIAYYTNVATFLPWIKANTGL